MKTLLKKNWIVIRFLGLFFGCYIVLSLIYGAYLKYNVIDAQTPDYITKMVASQSENIIKAFGYQSKIEPSVIKPSMDLWVQDDLVATVIEGCNAISVMILFISFVLSFPASWKKTLLYIFAGSVLIYAVNLLRIALLAIALYRYPSSQELLHGLVFPAIIYGLVFLLWVFWIRATTLKPKRDE